MKTKFAAVALLLSATLCCSDSYGHDLLHRMLGRGGCGGCDTAPTCCDTPAPSCGGRTLSININLPGRGLLAGLRNPGCGCGTAPVSECGCDVAPVADCGCDTGCDSGCGSQGGLLTGMFQGRRCGGCGLFKGGIGDGCGCDLMESTPCASACDEVSACCDSGLLNGRLRSGRLRGRISGLFNRGGSCGGCGAPAADCGCGTPVSDCGCGAPAGDCGCGSVAAPAPFVSTAAPCDSCGSADGGCGCGGKLRGRVSGLLSRVGNVRGAGCGSCGSTSACGCDVVPVADCGCDVAPVSACDSCGDLAGGCGCGGGLNVRHRVGGLLSRVGNSGCDTCGSTSGCGCGRKNIVRNVVARVPRPLQNRSCGCGVPMGSDCGCGGTVSDCGCGASAGGCGCGSSKLSLLDRLRGNRISESRRGCASCNDGCNPPCPNSGCGGVGSGCAGGCNGSSEQSYDPMSPSTVYDQGTMQYDANSVISAPVETQGIIGTQAVPAAPAVEGDVVVPGGDGANRARTPVVDPNAFIIRNAGFRN